MRLSVTSLACDTEGLVAAAHTACVSPHPSGSVACGFGVPLTPQWPSGSPKFTFLLTLHFCILFVFLFVCGLSLCFSLSLSLSPSLPLSLSPPLSLSLSLSLSL